MESQISYCSPDDMYRSIRARYVHHIKELRKSGQLDFRAYGDWEANGVIDETKFPLVKQLWDQLETLYPQTKAGRREAEAATGDTVLAPIIEAEESNPLDAKLLASQWPIGFSTVDKLASMFDTDAATFLASFRRVRTKLEGVKAFECLHNGQLALEIVEASRED